MTVWFAITVFGKIVFSVGPLSFDACQFTLDTYQPPDLSDAVRIADGRILTPDDYHPVCIVSPVMPPLGVFDRGTAT